MKIHKAHRNILDQDKTCLDQWILKIEKLKDKIDKEKYLTKKEKESRSED